MQFINTAIQFTTIASVLFFGSLFISGLVNRYRLVKSAAVADLSQSEFIPNPDGFGEATEEEAGLVNAHSQFVAQYWAKRPTNNVVPFIRPVAKSVPNWATMTPEQLRKECQVRSIAWRNAHGRNKHLKKAEMVALLSA